jgi:hypothetical protein
MTYRIIATAKKREEVRYKTQGSAVRAAHDASGADAPTALTCVALRI